MKYGLLIPLLLCAPAAAETLKAVPVQLDPTKAYVLVEYQQEANSMANFPGSRKYMPLMSGLTLARYDAKRRDVLGYGKAVNDPAAKPPAFELFQKRPVAKGEGRQMMLLALMPDTYVVLGYGGTSFSLGSYTFRAEPGVVTDLGIVEAIADYPEGEAPKPITAGSLFKMALVGPFGKAPPIAPMRAVFHPRTASDLAIPASLAAAVRPATFQPGATFGNYLGGTVNRIEGVNAGKH